MGKKIWYSKPLSDMWEQYKKYHRLYKGTVEDFFKVKNNQILTTYDASPLDIQSWTSILDLWRLDAHQKFIHIYFKDKELRDYLANMKLHDLDGIVEFLFSKGENFYYAPSLDTKNVLVKPEETIKTYSFGIHIPYEKEDKGYAFQLTYNESKEMSLLWAQGTNQGWCSADTYKENLNGKGEHAEFFAYTFRLAINTIAYMNAFPECVTEGVPPTEEESLSYILNTSEKINETVKNPDLNRTVTPHFRNGYFKFCGSDFYKEKRNQIIFVSETMVNGKAKTVEKSKNEDKLKLFESE